MWHLPQGAGSSRSPGSRWSARSGPLLLSLVRPAVSPALRVVYGGLVGAFTLAVLLHRPRTAAVLGTAVAGAWLLAVLGGRWHASTREASAR